MKLENIYKITGQIIIKTGLHIGGSNEIIEIGGVDSPFIKNILTGEPYIPGSSLKGKMRMLLEWYEGKIDKDGKVHECNEINCPICTIFGLSSNKKENNIGPTRIVVRDANLNEDWKEYFIKEKDLTIIESKTENNINRINAKANPRTIERVPAGAKFDFEMIYKKFDLENKIDDEKNFLYILLAMKLLELDYLGGGGSRGSGKIKFENIKKINMIDNSTEDIEIPEIKELEKKIKS